MIWFGWRRRSRPSPTTSRGRELHRARRGRDRRAVEVDDEVAERRAHPGHRRRRARRLLGRQRRGSARRGRARRAGGRSRRASAARAGCATAPTGTAVGLVERERVAGPIVEPFETDGDRRGLREQRGGPLRLARPTGRPTPRSAPRTRRIARTSGCRVDVDRAARRELDHEHLGASRFAPRIESRISVAFGGSMSPSTWMTSMPVLRVARCARAGGVAGADVAEQQQRAEREHDERSGCGGVRGDRRRRRQSGLP